MAVKKVMGTEGEYGISVINDKDCDPISSCVLLVNSYRDEGGAKILWDYDQENPLADARGFQADGEKYTPNQQENIARNKTLENGARYYVDHAHPAYPCPAAASVQADRRAPDGLLRVASDLHRCREGRHGEPVAPV